MHERDGEIQRGLKLLIESGAVAELRVLNTKQATVSGYFDNTEGLAAQARRLSGQAPGVYVTLNPVDPVLLSRAVNRVQPYAKHTTSDSDILKRRWLPLDFDPVRPSGISSTEQEHEAALYRAIECREWLRKLGWPEPLMADSGNGAHLLYRIDLPNDDDARKLVQTCLEALALRFDDAEVGVDLTTYNAARIFKVYGTLAAKGDSTETRPHRFARLLDVPRQLQAVPVELLNQLAESTPQRSTPSKLASRDTFDLDEWLAEHGIGIARSGLWQGGRKYIFDECPWNSDHRDGAAYVVQLANGAIAAGCHHNGCSGKDWRALRELHDPEIAVGISTDIVSVAPREVVPAERKLTFRTGRQFADYTPAQVPWVVQGLVAQGAITEIDGKIKSSGKTTFLTQMARAILDGEAFLSLPTQKTGVVYLTEQSDTSFREAMARAGLLDRDDFALLPWHETIGVAWEDIVRAAVKECQQREAGVLIIDTLPQWAGIHGEGENSAGAALEAMRPLQEAAGLHGLAIPLSRHERKSGGEIGDSGRGSSAFGGAVDIILSLRRTEGAGNENSRVLESLSRFSETPNKLVIELQDSGYVALGTEEAVATEKARSAILSAAPDSEKHAKTQDELVEAAGAKPTTGKEAIRALSAEGQLTQVGGGKKNSPYRYFLSAETSMPRATGKIIPFPHPSELPNDPDGSRALTLALAVELDFPRVQGFCLGGQAEWQRFAERAPREILCSAIGELEELGDGRAVG